MKKKNLTKLNFKSCFKKKDNLGSQGIEVDNDIFEKFIECCEKADKPNEKLIKDLAFTKEKGFY
jgi:hypothetical protein